MTNHRRRKPGMTVESGRYGHCRTDGRSVVRCHGVSHHGGGAHIDISLVFARCQLSSDLRKVEVPSSRRSTGSGLQAQS